MRKQFVLDHEVNRPEVQNQINWLLKHPDYIKRFARAEPYMYHILNEIKKRNLPGELALVPIIESAFDPFAYSGVGAAGLWQIMPETGHDLGLKRDWWVDPRRSIGPSTEAALKYYTYLNKFFYGNWLLAIAAYDSGEGQVARAIRRSGQTRANAHFWQLRLPTETKIYVPRLLALAEIIKHPSRYQIQLPQILYEPYFEEVDIGQQIDLSHAAKLAGISYQDLIQLNPGFNRWATAPYAPYRLLLPKNRAKLFAYNLALLPKNEWLEWSRHHVQAGESLSVIAQKYRTTAALIKSFNHLKSDILQNGQYILVPHPADTNQPIHLAKKTEQPSLPAPQSYKVVHITQKRDSFEVLARRYGVTEADVRAWNHLGKEHPLQPGQELLIWRQKTSRDYVVKSGDSLSKIASDHHMSMKKILALNPSIDKNKIRPGQTIQLG